MLAAIVVVAGVALLIAGTLQTSLDSPAGGITTYTEFADSANHVKASLTKTGQDGVITLHIGDGWHVNANPAPLDNLIPTSVLVVGAGEERSVQADYPAGKNRGIKIDTRSEEHTSELQTLMRLSYAVSCLKNKKKRINRQKEDK